MRKFYRLIPAFFFASTAFCQTDDSTIIANLYKEVLLRGKAYTQLDSLANGIGARLSGSPSAQLAVEWGFRSMKQMGIDSVWLQPVMVPHWVRGNIQNCSLRYGKYPHFINEKFNICALGGSISTPPEGLYARLIFVDSVSDLKKLGREKIQGKIVVFNRPMDESQVSTFQAYGNAVDQRWAGPAEAARYGAIATLCRSMEAGLSRFPHTGSMAYQDSVKKIPCAAIATNDAEELFKLYNRFPNAELFLQFNCETLPDVLSYNVIGEIKGSTFPEEIILVGGHLDSWDNGDGAHDDGAGCVQSMEVLRLYKSLGLKPKRTIRAVLFMNEENGLRGGLKYAEMALQNKEKHLAAIETDAGGFTPRGFGLSGDSASFVKLLSWKRLFEPYQITDFKNKGGGADIGPLKKQGVPLIGYMPDSQRYFDIHHTEKDIFSAVNKRELHLGAGALAALIWMISEHGL